MSKDIDLQYYRPLQDQTVHSKVKAQFDTPFSLLEETDAPLLRDTIMQLAMKAHDDLKLEPLPEGWEYSVEVATEYLPQDNLIRTRMTYTPQLIQDKDGE